MLFYNIYQMIAIILTELIKKIDYNSKKPPKLAVYFIWQQIAKCKRIPLSQQISMHLFQRLWHYSVYRLAKREIKSTRRGAHKIRVSPSQIPLGLLGYTHYIADDWVVDTVDGID